VALIKRGLIVAAIVVLNIASALAEPVYCSVWNGHTHLFRSRRLRAP
jgi:hypothetical protein